MVRDLTEAEKEMIINLGAMAYDANTISQILLIDKNEIEKSILDASSEFGSLYNKGKLMGQYVIDLKLFEMTKAGDLNALSRYEARIRARGRK